jgi:hypothetical protein
LSALVSISNKGALTTRELNAQRCSASYRKDTKQGEEGTGIGIAGMAGIGMQMRGDAARRQEGVKGW